MMSTLNVRRYSLTILTLVLALTAGAARAAAQAVVTGTTTPVNTNPASQLDPAVSGSTVVWTDQRNGNDDIFYRDSSGVEVQLTTATTPQRLHDVSGAIIVYTDLTPPVALVRAFNTATNSDLGVISPDSAQNPRIDGALVAYEVGPVGATDVWVTDLTTGSMTPIAISPAVEANPVVSGTRIAFERRATLSAQSDIVVYDMATGIESVVASGPTDERRPDIDGDRLVYDGVTEAGDIDVHVHDLATGVTTPIVLPADQRLAHISGDVVVFDTQVDAGNANVVLVHIPTGTQHPVAESPDNDFLNDISGNRIVYTSTVSGNFDTWMYTFEIRLPEIEVAPLAHDFATVAVGSVATTVITISNTGSEPLTVSTIELDGGGSPAFEIVGGPLVDVLLAPGAAVAIGVRFAPSVAGTATATLNVSSDDTDEALVRVALSGVGQVASTPFQQLQDLLAFFDASVASGALVGTGSGLVAKARVALLRGLLVGAAILVNHGHQGAACGVLTVAFHLTDGHPVDMVTGAAASELASRIAGVRASLGGP